MKNRGAAALLGCEVTVARAEGEAVGFAHDRAGDKFHRKIEIAHHGAENGNLRGILLAEVGSVGRDDVKELGDDGGHSAKVAGTAGAVEAVAGAGDFNEGGCSGGRERFSGWSEENVNTGSGERGAVCVKGAWIAAEVLVGAELQGVDEDAGGNMSAIALCRIDKREMARVQRAHGGHKSERAAAAKLAGSVLHLGNGSDDTHEINQSVLFDLMVARIIARCVSVVRA